MDGNCWHSFTTTFLRTSLQRIKVSPEMPGAPDVWLLGSSGERGAPAQFGLPYAFAHFIGPEQTVAALAHYRLHFRPSNTCVNRVPSSRW